MSRSKDLPVANIAESAVSTTRGSHFGTAGVNDRFATP